MTGPGRRPIHIERLDGGDLLVNADFAEFLASNGVTTAQELWDLPGESVKNVLAERGTTRVLLRPTHGSEPIECYLKRYLPISFRETLKALISLKPFGFDARHEWNAVLAFHGHDLPTMLPMAMGVLRDGKTCNLTLGLQKCTRASDLFCGFQAKNWPRKRRLIRKIAEMAGRMHARGFAHQDFYLVHLFVREDQDDHVYLIDLQRLIMRARLGRRWRVKDLGELLFSAREYVSKTDILRFWKAYTETAGPNLYRDKRLIRSIVAKAQRIRARDMRKQSERA